MMHPQVMLGVWLINDQPIPPINGAPLRLVIPFRYGAPSVKAISEITLRLPQPSATRGAHEELSCRAKQRAGIAGGGEQPQEGGITSSRL